VVAVVHGVVAPQPGPTVGANLNGAAVAALQVARAVDAALRRYVGETAVFADGLAAAVDVHAGAAAATALGREDDVDAAQRDRRRLEEDRAAAATAGAGHAGGPGRGHTATAADVDAADAVELDLGRAHDLDRAAAGGHDVTVGRRLAAGAAAAQRHQRVTEAGLPGGAARELAAGSPRGAGVIAATAAATALLTVAEAVGAAVAAGTACRDRGLVLEAARRRVVWPLADRSIGPAIVTSPATTNTSAGASSSV